MWDTQLAIGEARRENVGKLYLSRQERAFGEIRSTALRFQHLGCYFFFMCAKKYNTTRRECHLLNADGILIISKSEAGP
jgi:hypothetical protein